MTTRALVDRVLLTNDDGIDAPGIKILEDIACTLAREVWVVAPEFDQSGTSHSVSLHAPLRVVQKGARHFAISGTPGDSVVMAVRHLMRETPPDLVLSGINRGSNLGVETIFSGTVGGAMTGMLLGIKAIALSQLFSDRERVRWETARALAPAVLTRLLTTSWPDQVCLNVNFPDVAPERAGPLRVTQQGAGMVQGMDVQPEVDPRGIPYFWLRFRRAAQDDLPDSETVTVHRGSVTVTPLRFERTDDSALRALRDALGD